MENENKTVPETAEVVDIQFRPGQKVYYFDPAGHTCKAGDHVIIDTARGPEYGICAAPTGASGTITENRIVWSRIAGIRMDRAGSWNITGCFFDRAFGPAIWLGHDGRANDITISGNMIRRSGKPRQTPFDSPFESSQILIEKGSNISVNGNTFAVGRDDGGKGTFSPDYGIVMRECTDCVISANALQKGSLKQNIVLDSCRDVELLGNVGRSVEEDAQK